MIRPTPPAAAWTRIVSPVCDREDRAKQHLRGHSLEHHRRRLLGRDSVGQLHHPVGVDQPLLGIAADRPGISDAVAACTLATSGPTASTTPAPSTPGRERHRLLVEPGAVIDVDEVEAGRFLAEPDLARARARRLRPPPTGGLGPSGLMDSDRVRHGALQRLQRQKKSPAAARRDGAPLQSSDDQTAAWAASAASSSSATMLVILIIGLTAGPAVSL